MTAVRRPVIAGVTHGSGTSTLAAALHTIDGGLLAPGTAGEADVLVCRSDEQSLRQAAALACAPSGPRPVLVLAGIAPGIPTPTVPPGRFGGRRFRGAAEEPEPGHARHLPGGTAERSGQPVPAGTTRLPVLREPAPGCGRRAGTAPRRSPAGRSGAAVRAGGIGHGSPIGRARGMAPAAEPGAQVPGASTTVRALPATVGRNRGSDLRL